MTQTSLLIVAALLFGAAVAVQFIKTHGTVTREFIDEVSEILVTVSTFCFMVAVMFF